jgi:hypothetical protein
MTPRSDKILSILSRHSDKIGPLNKSILSKALEGRNIETREIEAAVAESIQLKGYNLSFIRAFCVYSFISDPKE